MRDCKSEYVLNGKFMYTVFQMAFEEYIRDMKEYYNHSPGIFDINNNFYNPNVASRDEKEKKKQEPTDLTQLLERGKI